MTATTPEPRRCGDCGECCTALAVPSLRKPAGEPCPHDRGPRSTRRCGLYDKPERPPECRAFSCAWANRVLPAKHRPDAAGVVAVANEGVLALHESAAGNVERHRARPMLARVMATSTRNRLPVFRIRPDGSKSLIVSGN